MRTELRLVTAAACVAWLASPLIGQTGPPAPATIVLTGSLHAAKADRFSVPVTGNWNLQLKWLIEEGSPAQSGEPIARFDSAGVEDSLASAEEILADQIEERALAVSDGTLRRLELELEQRRAEVELRKAELDADVPEEALKGVDFQERQLARQRAGKRHEDALLALEAHDESHSATLTDHDVKLAKLRETIERSNEELDSLVLRAVNPGIVVHDEHPWFGRKVREGDRLQATFPVASIPDLATLEVEAWAPEIDLIRIREDQIARLVLDAYPQRRLTGRVTEIAQGGEERDQWGKAPYFRVRIAIDNPDPAVMKPGMSVRCVIETAPEGA